VAFVIPRPNKRLKLTGAAKRGRIGFVRLLIGGNRARLRHARIHSRIKCQDFTGNLVRPNKRLKLSARGGRVVGNRSVLSAAAAGRSLSAIR